MSLSYEEAELRIQKCLHDTGYLARNILGYNHDLDWQTGEVVPNGGVRKHGPHGQMTSFLDDTSTRYKHMLAPRGSYKTSIITAYIVRRLLLNPNERILYGSDVYGDPSAGALKVVQNVKKIFETNTKLKELFGNRVGSPWNNKALTVLGRTYSEYSKDPSLSGYGVNKDVTGGHYTIIILDDIVSLLNTENSEQIEKVIARYRALQPLLDPGGTLIVNGTRYKDNDLHGYLIENDRGHWDRLILDAGVDVEKNELGEPVIVGDSIWPHQPRSYLEQELHEMQWDFVPQYLNRCISSAQQIFQRHHFKSMRWEEWMRQLSCYILTDTAVTEKDEAAYSVLAVVGIDHMDSAYLLDLEVGHWSPDGFAERFCDTVEKWQHWVMLRGATFEQIALNTALQANIKPRMRERNLRIRLISIPRGANVDSKPRRIKGLHGRFVDGRFTVVMSGNGGPECTPMHFVDLGKRKLLFDPEKIVDGQDGPALPDGELVLEFIRLGVHGKNDIADALADIEALDKKGNRLVKPMPLKDSVQMERRRMASGERTALPMRMLLNGREQFVNMVPTGKPERSSGGSWASSKMRRMKKR